MEIKEVKNNLYKSFITFNSKNFFNANNFEKPNRTLQSIRDSQSEGGLMLDHSMIRYMMETLPSFVSYLRIFSCYYKIEFADECIVAHGPLDHGRVTSSTMQACYDHSIFCRLIDAGMLTRTLSRHKYFDFSSREYTKADSETRYKIVIRDIGLGAELMSLLYVESTSYDMEAQLVMADKPTNVEGITPQSLVDALSVAAPVIAADKLLNNMCLLYESNGEMPCREKLIHPNGDGVVYVNSAIADGPICNVLSVSLDATEIVPELDLKSSVVAISVESPSCVVIPVVSLYDKTKELMNEAEMFRFTTGMTKYEVKKKRHMVTRVLDLRAYRRTLISEAVRHQKIKKYNPRQYVFFSLYIMGKAKVRLTHYSFGKEAKERGPFLLYKGPIIRKGQKYNPLFSTGLEVAAGLMTPPRMIFVREDPELITHPDIYHYTIPELTTGLEELLAPMHKCIEAKVCECPAHKSHMCGVSFSHKRNSRIYIPPICYNLQPNLMEYVVMWLNTRYYRRPDGVWMFRYSQKEDRPFEVYTQECEFRDLTVPISIIDYSKLMFVTDEKGLIPM